ncbi:MAG: crossover junction endodeoxyribonuclease RuvC [Spirochaetia bacterium]|nr:crossover junction endodeoxyribonuclease RuvC [Spirochaetia bacterium]MCF7940449.1 crossover junction endodeoxyribonuclease RuvC [Spirochaetia bacterium]
MMILGIDPGIANLGWGVVSTGSGRLHCEAYGHMKTKADAPVESRIQELAGLCNDLFTTYPIDQMSIEDIYYFQNKSSAITVAKVIGALYYVASLQQVAVTTYSPLQIKTTITGFGRAEKLQIQEMVRVLLGLPSIPRPDHAADALAIAICHYTQREGKERLGIYD